MKKIVILQSNYIPWKGYFDAMNTADIFVLYDEMQYTKNDWRNRNKIKTPNGLQWLTIPVKQNSINQKINETKVVNNRWRKKHWKTIKQNYIKAPFFKQFAPFFEEIYESDEVLLSEINYSFIKVVNKILNIDTELVWSKDISFGEGKTERLVRICQLFEGTHYFSGPAARNYLNESLFEDSGIALKYFGYSGYTEYVQLYGPFEHQVTVLDLIFNVGENAYKYMKSF